ncbi:hypothetical protein CEXT_264871 [Caerostris extrusa]|uniref:Maturase K n=1 Tax=Caerostris extrusa TaxID=172846 RepID=A0AAV4WUH3_CAEEX|nr:hypothetical protein CEXT_264871 [Caerostris extrusa]
MGMEFQNALLFTTREKYRASRNSCSGSEIRIFDFISSSRRSEGYREFYGLRLRRIVKILRGHISESFLRSDLRHILSNGCIIVVAD